MRRDAQQRLKWHHKRRATTTGEPPNAARRIAFPVSSGRRERSPMPNWSLWGIAFALPPTEETGKAIYVPPIHGRGY